MENDGQDQKKLAALKRIAFFKEFNDDELIHLLKITEWIKYGKGDIIVKEGENEKTFYVILKGSVSIKKRIGGSGLKKTLNTVPAGESFGEMSSFITGRPRSADIITEEETYVLRFNADEIHKEQDNPKYASILFKFYKKFAEILAERLEEADREILNPPM